MRMVNNGNNDKINSMISIAKIGIMLFVGIMIYQGMPNYITDIDINFGHSILICLSITALIHIIWMVTNKKAIAKFRNFKGLPLIQIFFFITIVSLPMHLFGSYQSEFKFVFLIIIILTVIEYGLSYGITSSILSAIIILGIDLIYAPVVDGINMFFEKDIIVAIIFIFVAVILGYYVELENENNKQKENQLRLLNNELEEQNSQRQNIEALLLKNEICYDMLFENSMNAIIIHEEGKIIYANKSAAKLLGYENPIQLTNQLFYKHYPENSIMSIKTKYLNIIDNKLSKVIGEETIVSCENKSIEVRNSSSFFTYNYKPSVLTFLLDITDEKQLITLKDDVEKNLKLLNETREYNLIITEFFANISHELRTPLNVIYSTVQLLKSLDESKNLGDERIKYYFRIMNQNIFRLLRLINNLIDTTKLNGNYLNLHLTRGNIVYLIEELVQSVADFVQSNGINIIFDTEVEEKITTFDEEKIERIILNLLSNAVKFTDENGTIFINIYDKGDYIEISIKDTGIGIPKDKLAFIFERFAQVDKSTTRSNEGSGIGLSLVKSLVELQGGNIQVKSELGKGSEFIITFPVNACNGKEIGDSLINESVSKSRYEEKLQIEFSDIYL